MNINAQLLKDASNTIRFLSADGVKKGKFRPSRHAYGYGRLYGRSLAQVSQIQSLRSAVAESGPLLYFPPGTVRCCCIRFCILPASG